MMQMLNGTEQLQQLLVRCTASAPDMQNLESRPKGLWVVVVTMSQCSKGDGCSPDPKAWAKPVSHTCQGDIRRQGCVA